MDIDNYNSFDNLQEQLWMVLFQDIHVNEDLDLDLIDEETNEIEDDLDMEDDIWIEDMIIHENEVIDDILFCEENSTTGAPLIYDLCCLWARTSNLMMSTLINYDIFYYIYNCSPIFMSGERSPRVVRSARMDTYEQYWTVKHPNLNDDPKSRKSYRAHYRINKKTFQWLVARLSNSSHYAGSIVQGGYSVEIQVACVLWRFANTHFGYRIAEVTLGVSAGSYRNFTERFINAMVDMSNEVISWPIGNSARALENSEEFYELGGPNNMRLKGILGCIDGKLVTIQKPSVNGNAHVDRKNNASMNLTAVCDARCRFMYAKTGHSGKCMS